MKKFKVTALIVSLSMVVSNIAFATDNESLEVENEVTKEIVQTEEEINETPIPTATAEPIVEGIGTDTPVDEGLGGGTVKPVESAEPVESVTPVESAEPVESEEPVETLPTIEIEPVEVDTTTDNIETMVNVATGGSTGSSALYSGTCGDNLNWIIYENGLLYIYGTGDMYLSIF